MIKRILQCEEFQTQPPVLVDVGASGGLPPAWKTIAPFSVCVGFDADSRATDFAVSEDKGFKKLYVLNRLIGEPEKNVPFYLTESPYCSSILEPDLEALKPYQFGNLFRVKSQVALPAVDLKTALKTLDIDYVDWFKTDSQGTDLRVFQSLGNDLMNKVIIAEFEPGIMNAYKGEDKMHKIMSFMEDRHFWLFDLKIHGPIRISRENLHRLFSKFVQESIDLVHKEAPFWGEMSYFSDLTHDCSKRRLLFGCACALIHEQYGFCIELAQKGQRIHGDSFFEEICRHAVFQINRNCSFYTHLRAFWRILKRWYSQILPKD